MQSLQDWKVVLCFYSEDNSQRVEKEPDFNASDFKAESQDVLKYKMDRSN